MGARPWDGRAPVPAGLGHGRPTWPSSPVGGLGGRPGVVVLPFRAYFLWFSGLFSKHRSRMNVILGPLRSSLRYGRNGPCFVGFRGRLTLQTPRNVEGYHQKGLIGDPVGGPLPQGVTLGARPWDGRALVTAELGHGRPP